MSNHIYLLLKQVQDEGISKFMRKVGGGYANYFNNKYQRKGHLFNQFKAVHVKDYSQLINVVTYIHCNPISLAEPGWKENGIADYDKILDFLENKYRWSSLWDYNGKANFASVTIRNFILDYLGKEVMREELKSWIKYKKDLHDAISGSKDFLIE